jgi:hypothetical protein
MEGVRRQPLEKEMRSTSGCLTEAVRLIELAHGMLGANRDSLALTYLDLATQALALERDSLAASSAGQATTAPKLNSVQEV